MGTYSRTGRALLVEPFHGRASVAGRVSGVVAFEGRCSYIAESLLQILNASMSEMPESVQCPASFSLLCLWFVRPACPAIAINRLCLISHQQGA